MPIVAVCPYCREGKVRAPDKAVGLSATCPKCFNCFTVVETKDLPTEKPSPRAPTRALAAVPAAPVPPPAAPSPTAVAVDQRPVPPVGVVAPKRRPTPAPAPAVEQEDDEDPVERYRNQGDSSFAMALIAITVAGLGVGLSQLPYGRFVTVVLAAIGIMVGGLALLTADRNRLWPAVGMMANVGALVLVTLLPGWLGLDSWLPATVVDDSNQIRLVGLDGHKATQPLGEGDWLDVTKGMWERGDVRVTVAAVSFGPIKLTGPKDKQKVTKEKYLVVTVQVRNSGVARMFDYRSWNEKPATPDALAVKLTDSAGKEWKPATFPDGWDLPGRGKSGAVMPGRSLDDLLVFEAPAEAVDSLKLELPFDAFGEKGQLVRLLIPKGMSGRNNFVPDLRGK